MRAPTEHRGRRRPAARMRRYGLDPTRLDERVAIVLGDPERPRFGLDEATSSRGSTGPGSSNSAAVCAVSTRPSAIAFVFDDFSPHRPRRGTAASATGRGSFTSTAPSTRRPQRARAA
ncbi:hypothetical protein [Embleya sp. MST-111070]|uniref:hypothetical protein n=1 Tax=Embleya sp. MST-111070 TaxID=3398231 RepID=UPI003F739101